MLNTTVVWAANTLPSGIIEQIDPGRTGEELLTPDIPPSLPDPQVLPASPEDKSGLNSLENINLTLSGIKFTGNKIFSDEQLTQFSQEYIGKRIKIIDVKKIANSITVFYRNAGYILTRVVIPPQEVGVNGILTLQIVEGYVENFTVEGYLRPATKKLLMAYARNIAQQKPLTLAVLERYSLLANDIPGTKVRAVLRASESTPGAADLVLIAEQERNNWYAGANNFSSKLLGREQMMGGINANGYLPGSQTGIRAVLSFYVKRMQYFALLHKQQLNTNGLSLDLNISATNTSPNFESIDLLALQTPGKAFILNAVTKYPLIRSRKKNLSVGVGFNYLNSKTSYSDIRLFDDAIRSVELDLSYNFFTSDASLNTVDIGAHQGLNVFNAHASPPTIPGGKTNFSKFTISANRYQRLLKDNFYLLLWIKGQYSLTQLLSSEKFGFGGAPFGYGYDPSVINGDQGYALKIEPQYNYLLKNNIVPYLQFFAFLDTASVWNINKTVQVAHQSATSMGIGLRTIFYKRLSAEFIIAQPFDVYATNNNSKNTRCMFNLFYNGSQIFG